MAKDMKAAKKGVRIGCYSAFWGDTVEAARQLVEANDAQLDYLVADYLAEVTLGLLARNKSASNSKARTKGSDQVGYIAEFLTLVLGPLLDIILRKGIKVIANAGGLDPVGLKALIEAHAEKAGVADKVKVAAVYGDDILEQQALFYQPGVARGFDPLNGAGVAEDMLRPKDGLLSLNAYIGAEPIAEALKRGANVIVTGRCVDSAAVLGPLAFEYGWDLFSLHSTHDLDRVASACLAGHILECGAQATGGNFTDWRLSASSPFGGWANMGYPIATVYEDGSMTISKPSKTGGIVTCNSVCEQILYEVLDPANYILPDVVMDLTHIELTQLSADRVMVRGVKGKAPTPLLKCTAIAQAGYRISTDLLVWGTEAEGKGLALGRAVLERANNCILSKYKGKVAAIANTDSQIIIVGADHSLSPLSTRSPGTAREIIVRVWAIHQNREALDILGKEVSSLVTSSAPGITVFSTGRPRSGPNLQMSSILVPRKYVVPKLVIGGSDAVLEVPFSTEGCQSIRTSASAITLVPKLAEATIPTAGSAVSSRSNNTRLIDVALGRSGDKGDNANVAIIARHPDVYPYILEQVNAEAIHLALGHLLAAGGTVTRYEVPGVHAVNFTITRCLGGGGLASLKLDRQGKGFAQICLATIWVNIPIRVMVNAKL